MKKIYTIKSFFSWFFFVLFIIFAVLCLVGLAGLLVNGLAATFGFGFIPHVIVLFSWCGVGVLAAAAVISIFLCLVIADTSYPPAR